MNVLNNIFKKNNKQPWKEYYQGIKPVNPLGGDVVRRMGNKVKSVVSSTVGGNKMSFTKDELNIHNFSRGNQWVLPVVTFGTQPIGYVPPYKPLSNTQGEKPYQPPGYIPSTQPSSIQPTATFPPGMSAEEYKVFMKQKREDERANRENSRDARRSISDTRASYRTILDTGREGRNWLKFISP